MKFHPRMDLGEVPAGAPIGLVCALEENLDHPPSPGCTRRVCPECLRAIRLAPSSQALLADAERRGVLVMVRCLECAREHMEKPDLEIGMAPGCLEELIEWTGGKSG